MYLLNAIQRNIFSIPEIKPFVWKMYCIILICNLFPQLSYYTKIHNVVCVHAMFCSVRRKNGVEKYLDKDQDK